jgi:hypothetical protein
VSNKESSLECRYEAVDLIRFFWIALLGFALPAAASGSDCQKPFQALVSNLPDKALTRFLAIMREKNVLESREYFEFLGENPVVTKAILGYWDELANPDWARLRSAGDRFLPLLTDPGIVSRRTGFREFFERFRRNHPQASAWELREAYKAELGSEKIYRAIWLSAEELEQVRREGIFSSAARNGSEELADRMRRFFGLGYERSQYVDTGPLYEMSQRRGAQESLAISTTKHPKLGAAIALHAGRPPEDQVPRKLYVFEMEVPQINVVRTVDGYAPAQVGYEEQRLGRQILGWKVGEDVYRHSPDVESFVFHWIPSGQIRGVQEVAEVPRFQSVIGTPGGGISHPELRDHPALR